MPDNKTSTTDSVVKSGGIAHDDAEIEDVTRDTYGFAQPEPVARNPRERAEAADRTAAALGIPGVVVPDEERSLKQESGCLAKASGRRAGL